MGAASAAISVKGGQPMMIKNTNAIRLGGPVFIDVTDDPAEWIKAHKTWGYSAAYCPLKADAPSELIRVFKREAEKANLVIAEVGAWSNPISPDTETRRKAVDYCCRQLELAEQIGAKCCVNIAGSRDPEKWDGPHRDNLSDDTFDLIVDTTRKIIDSVRPNHTFFTLETMPWIFPNSVDSYLALIKKIERERFAVHLDPVNLINSPERYYNNSALIHEAFTKLGPYMKSCHGKDTIITSDLTTHINETQPGLGNLDYRTYLQELSKLPDVPLMLEHMQEPEKYQAAVSFLKAVAADNHLQFSGL